MYGFDATGEHPHGTMKVIRYLRDAALFAPCYIALDWASYIEPLGPFNITPWNPQPALAIVWMMLSGVIQAPAVLATIVVADIVVRQAPGGYAITLVSSLVLASGYAAMAGVLKSALRDTGLHSTRDLTVFTAIILAGAGIVGAAFVGLLSVTGVLAGVPFYDAWMRFWLGDAVGILVTGPLIVATADQVRREALRSLARSPEAWIQPVVLAATLWLVFQAPEGDATRRFYLLFLPIIWIAMRGGMSGAIVAVAMVQIGVLLAIQWGTRLEVSILELQILVSALTLTGLFLGVVVDERQRAEAGLRESLRLAAAGEMAGAIAHEVNQPLTALTNYGHSAQMLLSGERAQMAELPEIIGKMLYEADRAANVVRRVRDFFRAGSTRLEPVGVAEVLAAARRMGEGTVGARSISIEIDSEANLPPLLVDRLQVELILHNLLANAVDSLVTAARPSARIRISAIRHDANQVRFVVADNGPGVGDGAHERVFQPFVSGKPSGMGLGLAVSRAMAEAHGGSLHAATRNHGEFHLVLPCATTS